jgi:hypothetical protein
MRRELAPNERASIARVVAALKFERDAMSGTPLAVLWADLRHELIGLGDGETERYAAMERDLGVPPGWR